MAYTLLTALATGVNVRINRAFDLGNKHRPDKRQDLLFSASGRAEVASNQSQIDRFTVGFTRLTYQEAADLLRFYEEGLCESEGLFSIETDTIFYPEALQCGAVVGGAAVQCGDPVEIRPWITELLQCGRRYRIADVATVSGLRLVPGTWEFSDTNKRLSFCRFAFFREVD